MNQLIEDFIDHFKSLSENEQLSLGKFFNQKTGGKLSPHNNPTPVVVALIMIDDNSEIKLLGIKRAIPPCIGGIALPSGYQDYMEDAATAAAREVFEETGLQTNPDDYEMFGNPVISPSNNELKFLKNKNIFSKEIMNDLLLNSEVQGFEIIEFNTSLCFPLHQDKVQKFFKEIPQKTKSLKIR